MTTHKEYLMKYSGIEFFTGPDVLDWEAEEDGKECTYFFTYGNVEIGCIATYTEAGRVNLFNVFVEPKFRGRHFAIEMLDAVINDVWSEDLDIVLQVSEDNVPALKLYEQCGFEIIETVEISE